MQPRSRDSLSFFEKEPWLRLVTWLPESKNKGGEEEQIIVAMTKVTLSGPERSLLPRLLSADGASL